MNKLHHLATICFLFYFVHPHLAQAQKKDPYADILFMVIDGEYEKATSKAERFTKKEKTRKDPEPFLLMSMAYYEISKDESMRDEFPRAFRDAVKYAYKGARYDKEGEFADKHAGFITELKVELMREARFYYDEGSWRKSVTHAKYVTRIDPDDLGAQLLKAAAEMRSRNEYQAKQTFVDALAIVEEGRVAVLESELKPFLRFGIMEYAEILKEQGEKQQAEPLLALGQDAFSDDKEFINFLRQY